MKRSGFRLFRKKTIQTSTTTGLAASKAVPDSRFAFVMNSQGASAALIEFTNAISAALEHVDLDDDSEDGPFEAQVKKLKSAVGEYSNSNADCCRFLTDWTNTRFTVELVNVAFQCAAAVYKKAPTSSSVDDGDGPTLLPSHRKPKAEGVSFTEFTYSEPSIGGTAKAIGAWKVESEVSSSRNEHLSAVIIAIRGSAKVVDHMVNLNGRPVPVNDFLHTENSFISNANISAHAGFLNGAKALLPQVMTSISRAQSTNIKHVVLTGHSAGGAVASLLYLRLLLDSAYKDSSLKFSCITFGAPPTLSVDITSALHTAPELENIRGFNLAFVNEFDIVPRADQTYVRTLIDIYRSIYKLPPLMEDAIDETDGTAERQAYVLPPLVFDQAEETVQETDASSARQWKLPKAEYNIIGDLVLLRKVRDTPLSDQVLLAQSINSAEFHNLLYCGKETHSRTEYVARVNTMLQGRFNRRDGW